MEFPTPHLPPPPPPPAILVIEAEDGIYNRVARELKFDPLRPPNAFERYLLGLGRS